ncbi:MAG TPA: hypothetical protein VK961_19605, partial [Chthoniobacter sp.]|nr:hypothetical protein [Chthoniobacter sp.]
MPLDDVLCAFAQAKAVPDVQLLEEYTRKYPAYADALTEFAVDLLIDDALADEPTVESDDDATVSPAVARAMSFFENALYEIETKSVSSAANAQARNIFANFDRSQIRAVATGLRANNTFVIKLRERSIRPETIASRTGFCQEVANVVHEPLDVVIAHFRGPQEFARAQHFKSVGKPALATQESFEEAVRSSGLS